MRRSTRSQVRHDAVGGDPYHQPQQPYFGGGNYEAMGMSGGMQMGGGMPMNMGMLHMPSNPTGTAWHPAPEGFLSMNVASGYQQQPTYNPGYGYQQLQPHYPHPHSSMDMTSHHQYQYQQHQHQHEDQSSGRSLRPRQQPQPAAVAGPSAVVSGSSAADKKRRGGSTAASTIKVARSSSDVGTVEMEEDDDDDDSDDEDVEGQTAPVQSQKKSQKSSTSAGGGTTLTLDEMVRNGLYYFLLQQHKKYPIKKSDLLKNAMNSQSELFPEAMRKLEAALKTIFGMKLVRLESNKNSNLTMPPPATSRPDEEETEGTTPAAVPGPSSDLRKKIFSKSGKSRRTASTECFVLVSEYPSNVCDSVMRRDPEADSKKTVLYLLLSTIFMLNRSIDEELVWKIITGMQLDQMVCQKKVDLRRFLKTEFVLSGYLNMEHPDKENPTVTRMKQATQTSRESAKDKKSQSEELPGMKYSWGPRAELEYLKYPMLKFVAARFGKSPYEFTVQYNMIKRKEMDLIQKDIGEERESDVEQNEATEGRNGSAIQLRQRAGGRETYVIGVENEETETEEDQ